jgi:hypothetical protein
MRRLTHTPFWNAGLAALCAASVMDARVHGQDAAAQPQRPSVQVGVPEGRPGAARPAAPPRQPAGPPRPAPRNGAGRALLGGAAPTEKGVWLPQPVVRNPLGIADIPFQPWARALFKDREANELEPHTRCKPSGASRQFLTPYGVEMVEMPELQRLFIFDIGGPHTFRTVYMDGRSHPATLEPTYYGHSIGWWEGDTLVIDTVGYNERFWLDRDGLPHTQQLHTLERFTRLDFPSMRYELTIDDPGAYTRPFSGAMTLRWEAGTELFEYQCQQANYASELMVGTFERADRTSAIVP